MSIDYNETKNIFATASDQYGCIIYDATTNIIIDSCKDLSIKWPVTSVSFRYDGKVIAIGMKDIDETWLYDVETKQIIKKIKGEDGLYSPTKNELIVKKIKDSNGSELLDGLDYYKFDESENPENIKLSDLSIATKFIFNSLGNKIIVAGVASYKIKIFNLDVLALQYIIEEPKLGGYLSVSPDNKYLMALWAGELYLLNIEKYTDITEPKIIQSLTISPNPTNDLLNIEYSLTKNTNIQITLSDIQGVFLSEILSGLQESGVHNLNYPILNLPSGTYFININVNGSISSKKFEIIR